MAPLIVEKPLARLVVFRTLKVREVLPRDTPVVLVNERFPVPPLASPKAMTHELPANVSSVFEIVRAVESVLAVAGGSADNLLRCRAVPTRQMVWQRWFFLDGHSEMLTAEQCETLSTNTSDAFWGK
jgi:hypothetical protein